MNAIQSAWFRIRILGGFILSGVLVGMPLAYFLGWSGALRAQFDVTAKMVDLAIPFVEIGELVAALLFLNAAVWMLYVQYPDITGSWPSFPVILDSIVGDWEWD